MFLSKLTLDARHPAARRDLSDAYQMHRTLARAFAADAHTPPARFLWRLEQHSGTQVCNVLLVQAAQAADWSVLAGMPGYALEVLGNKPVDLDTLLQNQVRYRFRLLANPTVTRAGKRYGLLREDEQLAWLDRQGERYGFVVQACLRSADARLYAHQSRRDHRIVLDTALFEGALMVQHADWLRQGLLNGLGHGKALGMGLLSLARLG